LESGRRVRAERRPACDAWQRLSHLRSAAHCGGASPSNRLSKIKAQRKAAFAVGTQEFWIVDTVERSTQVSYPNEPERTHAFSESVPVAMLAGQSLPVAVLFEAA
jgi:hypothetical protein